MVTKMHRGVKKKIVTLAAASVCFALAACGGGFAEADKENVPSETASETITETTVEATKGLAAETAKDGHVDFEALQAENPDIFAWIYIPGTEIDAPVLQSPESDDFYETHEANGEAKERGALYTEMANLMNMCDFNTIIHGKDSKEDDLFHPLHQFENPDFFEEHSEVYIYLPDNVLTYTIYAAYYDESSDILRRYDYTTYEGCKQYLDDFYSIREMGMNYRDGWEDLTPGHFLLTLNGTTDTEADRQYVVMAALVGDAAGKIDRAFVVE